MPLPGVRPADYQASPGPFQGPRKAVVPCIQMADQVVHYDAYYDDKPLQLFFPKGQKEVFMLLGLCHNTKKTYALM